jgi:hypothetical protein
MDAGLLLLRQLEFPKGEVRDMYLPPVPIGPASGIDSNILVPSLTLTLHVYAVVPLLGMEWMSQISPPGIIPTI